MTECNVVRDLMPLVIDGAASAESAKIVAEHVAECEPCAEVYAELQEEIHAEISAKEQAEFERAAKKMRKVRRLRICLLLLVVAVAVGSVVWYVIPKHDSGLLPLRSVNVQLLRMPESDHVYLLILPKKEGQSIGFSLAFDWRTDGLYQNLVIEDTTDTPYVPFYRFLLDEYVLKGGAMYTKNAKGQPMTAVEQIFLTDGYAETVLYVKGAEIPWASEELVAYMAAENAFESFRQVSLNDHMDAESWVEEYKALEAEMQRLEALVPEFQTR